MEFHKLSNKDISSKVVGMNYAPRIFLDEVNLEINSVFYDAEKSEHKYKA